jgi:hypothetical protein
VASFQRREAVSKVFGCHEDAKAQRRIKLKIKTLFLSAFVASFQNLTFKTASFSFLFVAPKHLRDAKFTTTCTEELQNVQECDAMIVTSGNLSW